jgi:hypothetical protein
MEVTEEIDSVGTPTDEIRAINETVLQGIKDNMPKVNPDKCAMIYCVFDATTTDPENPHRRICNPCRELLIWSRKTFPKYN